MDKVVGRVRGLTAGNYPENREEEQFHMNSQGDQLWAQSLPELTELTKLGESYVVVGTGVNALNALPTTVAQLTIQNAEPHGGKSYVISHVGLLNAGALAATAVFTLYAQVSTTLVALGAVSIVPKSISGRANYRGNGRARASTTVTADAWHSVGNSLVSGNSAANVMMSYVWNVQGRYFLPPYATFGLTSVVNAGTISCQPFIVWHEVMSIVG